jgi:protoporphyrinogen oxidase
MTQLESNLSSNPQKNVEGVAIIIGAGPAGLTAAFELATRSKIKPIIIEKSDAIGGLARTYNYKGNRIDIGPHRFFSKSDRVMDWWMSMMPVASENGKEQTISYHNKSRTVETKNGGANPEQDDLCMLTIQRRTRIYFLRKFFDYPISLKLETFTNLGPVKTVKIGLSYMKSVVMPIKPEKNLEQFITNRFGRELYLTFFKSYTEKVWGIPCDKISAAWGAQRIKGLSIIKALTHAAKKILQGNGDIRQKGTETSLVEQFFYPKLGTGSMWEEAARRVLESGGEIHHNQNVERLIIENNRVVGVEVKDSVTGETKTWRGDYFFSTMPIKELVQAFSNDVPKDVKRISDGLVYRDFVEVGVLVNRLEIFDQTPQGKKLISDNWIYIQESDVLMGRLQIYNNWGPYMLSDPAKVWLGAEYFCNENDHVWKLSDQEMIELCATELDRMRIANKSDVLDAMVIHMPKTYPGYFGTYEEFDKLRAYIDQFENLFLVGRNGMHKYNNQDHSMLTAMVAVDNIIDGVKSKDNIWDVNTEEEYHEEKS